MNINKYLKISALVLGLGLGVSSCNDDDFTETIFPEPSDKAATQFDAWLNKEYRDVYNMQFLYRYADAETSYDYDLTPVVLESAMKMAVLTKFVWYDAYAEAYGGGLGSLDPEFIRQTGPKMIQLIGSYMYHTDGTRTLGYATGGVKITFTGINLADFNNIQLLNNQYFHTMHHEFCHILHQRKNYPTEFNTYSNGLYDSSSWHTKNGGIQASKGFVTPYAASSYTEDFAETVSNYITRTDTDYTMLYWCAEQGWYTKDEESSGNTMQSAYCYYYYKNEAAREKDDRTYFMRYVSDEYNTDVRVQDEIGKNYRTPEAVDACVETYRTNFCNTYKDNEAKSSFGVKYNQLTDDQKAVIDERAANREFVFKVEDKDKVNGREILENKINIARKWFREAWNLDLDELRKIVQRRSGEYNAAKLNDLLKEIENTPF